MKTLPQNIEAEKAVIGALLEQHSETSHIMEFLKHEHFFNKKLGFVFSIVNRLLDANMQFDVIVVYEQIKPIENTMGVTLGYLDSLTGENINPLYHARIVYEKFVMRRLIESANEILEQAYNSDNDVFDLAASASESINNIVEGIVPDEETNLYDRLPGVFENIERRILSVSEESLQSHYFPTLNHWTGGIRENDYMQISGKDKHGKTTFAFSLALDFAIHQKIPVGIFSLEMENEVLAWKAISAECGIAYQRLRNPKNTYGGVAALSLSTLVDVKEESERIFRQAKIYTCDNILDERKIKSRMKKMVKDFGVKFFVVDYIGLIPTTGKFQTRELEIAYLSRFFKRATKELGVSVCVLSQQNRAGGIAESKGLDRDCDFAFSIQKPFEDGIKVIEMKVKDGKKNINLTENDFVITITRSRHGVQGRQFIARYYDNKFRETDYDNELEFPI